jgi:SAM-dependent methyltransferase
MTKAALQSGFEIPVCILCQSGESEHFPWGDFHLNLLPPIAVRKCSRCGMIFLAPRPDHHLRLEMLQGSVPNELRTYAAQPANYAAVTTQRTGIFEKRLEQLYLLYKSRNRDRAPIILDVGASAGNFVAIAREFGWKAFGIEPSSGGVRLARERGLIFPIGVAETLPFADNTFDIVHAHHVFEHLANPLTAVREAHRVLKSGGLIFIEVPNQLDNIMFHRDVWLGRLPQRQRTIRSIHHLWFFSPKTLRTMLVDIAFHNVVVRDSFAGVPQGWRMPLTIATRIVGRFAYGGDLLDAWGWK